MGPRTRWTCFSLFIAWKGHTSQNLPLQDSPAAQDGALDDHEQGRNGRLNAFRVCVFGCVKTALQFLARPRQAWVSACGVPPSCKCLRLNVSASRRPTSSFILYVSYPLTPLCSHNMGDLSTYSKLLHCLLSAPATLPPPCRLCKGRNCQAPRTLHGTWEGLQISLVNKLCPFSW